VLALEAGDERLKCGVGVRACERGHLVRDIRCEQPGTSDERLELCPLFTNLLQPPEQAQQSTGAGRLCGGAEPAEHPAECGWALRSE